MNLSPLLSPPTFSRQFAFKFNKLSAFFWPFFYIGGYIYGCYSHQKEPKSLKLLLKEPVFLVVTKVVTSFLEVLNFDLEFWQISGLAR